MAAQGLFHLQLQGFWPRRCGPPGLGNVSVVVVRARTGLGLTARLLTSSAGYDCGPRSGSGPAVEAGLGQSARNRANVMLIERRQNAAGKCRLQPLHVGER